MVLIRDYNHVFHLRIIHKTSPYLELWATATVAPTNAGIYVYSSESISIYLITSILEVANLPQFRLFPFLKYKTPEAFNRINMVNMDDCNNYARVISTSKKLIIATSRPQQTVKTEIRWLLKEQSNQSLLFAIPSVLVRCITALTYQNVQYLW